jgi:two-component system response regulator HydG
LFGHVKGAFPGATHNNKDGLLAIAEGGTVFLNEIGDLPIDLQAKLLRALQEKEIRPVGSVRRVPINVRILAATNRDLERAVADGTFRRDLFFRLNVLTLRIPPLRERRQDIPLLVAHFLERLGGDAGVEKTISGEALTVLLNYDWPGNIRELENCLERSCALSSSNEIQVRDLPAQVSSVPAELTASGGIVPIAELERQTILNALAQVNGDKMLAARLLGIGKTTLYRKLKEYASQN